MSRLFCYAPGLSMGDYLAKANGFTLVLTMIETREAIAAVDPIDYAES